MELIQIISLGRYFEVGLAIFIVSNLLSRKSNFDVFYVGLYLATILETIGGLGKFFISSGTIRGILIGIPSYQLQIFSLLISFYNFIDSKKWYHFLLSALFISSVVCTETRNAYLQLFLAFILFLVWVCRRKNWKRVLTVTSLLLLYLAIFIYGLNRLTELPKSNRIAQIAEGGGTIGWRWYLWDKSLGAFSSSPISGIGSGGFGRQFHNLPQVFNVKIDNIHKDMVLSSHNTVLGILAETGLIGIFSYLFWIYAVMKAITFANGKIKNNIFLVSASIMILIFLVSDFWSQNSFYPNFNYFMAIILGHLKGNKV